MRLSYTMLRNKHTFYFWLRSGHKQRNPFNNGRSARCIQCPAHMQQHPLSLCRRDKKRSGRRGVGSSWLSPLIYWIVFWRLVSECLSLLQLNHKKLRLWTKINRWNVQRRFFASITNIYRKLVAFFLLSCIVHRGATVEQDLFFSVPKGAVSFGLNLHLCCMIRNRRRVRRFLIVPY